MSALEVVPDTALTPTEARQITQQIALLAGSIADGMDRLVVRIREAQTGRAHEALGYRSWTEYVSVEFAGVLPRLQREPRADFVRELAASGMSTRAIAPVVGASKSTVADDLASVQKWTVEATQPVPAVTGINGKTYARPAPKAPEPDNEWAQVNADAQTSGLLDDLNAQRPYALALIRLTRAAEAVASVGVDIDTLAANIPATSTHRLPEIREAAEWLASFLAAVENGATP